MLPTRASACARTDSALVANACQQRLEDQGGGFGGGPFDRGEAILFDALKIDPHIINAKDRRMIWVVGMLCGGNNTSDGVTGLLIRPDVGKSRTAAMKLAIARPQSRRTIRSASPDPDHAQRGMSSAYGSAADKQEMIKLIRAAHDRGVTLFDTAEAYGSFVNEELVGEAPAPIRDKVVIATKFGFDIDLATGARNGGTNSRPEHIKAVADASLKRLKTARIDIF